MASLLSKFILPPPQLQAVIDKTAGFIAKNGMAFQQRIMEAEQSTKFSFLLNDDPYYKYFEYTLNLIKQGQLPESLIKEEVETEVVIKPETPPELKFLTDIGTMNRMDLDLIKLVARYTARFGQSFHLQLMQKEKSNFRFHFLRPTNSKHALYQSYVNQFKYMNENKHELESFLKVVSDDPLILLPQIIQRTEYLQYLQYEAQNENEKQDNLRDLYDSIDWHDYTVQEHVQFGIADAHEEYPPPLTLHQLKTMSTEEKQRKLRDVEQTMDFIEKQINEQLPEAATLDAANESSSGVEMDISDEELPETNLNIKQPKATLAEKVQTIFQICPRCNLKFKEAEMESHIKTCLHDPVHEEQMLKYEEKHAKSNIAADSEIAKNIQSRHVVVENKAELVWDGKQHTRQKVIEESKKRKLKEMEAPIAENKESFDIVVQLPVDTGKYKEKCKGQALLFTINIQQSIVDLKKMINEKTEIPWSKIKILRETQILKNAMKLKELEENQVLNVKF